LGVYQARKRNTPGHYLLPVSRSFSTAMPSSCSRFLLIIVFAFDLPWFLPGSTA